MKYVCPACKGSGKVFGYAAHNLCEPLLEDCGICIGQKMPPFVWIQNRSDVTVDAIKEPTWDDSAKSEPAPTSTTLESDSTIPKTVSTSVEQSALPEPSEAAS